jgi:hypothetical protein
VAVAVVMAIDMERRRKHCKKRTRKRKWKVNVVCIGFLSNELFFCLCSMSL